MPMHDIELLRGNIRQDNGHYHPEGLSVVLMAMDEYELFFDRLSRKVAEHYEQLVLLAFECASEAFDPYKEHRKELVERVYKDAALLRNIAWHSMLTTPDRQYINGVANSVRSRAFVFDRALHQSG